MSYRTPYFAALAALAVGCVETTDGLERLDGVQAPDSIGSIRAALDACSETVPDNRRVDGIPAYAQCASIENGAIYSNNGIDTSATKVGSDWVRTQFAGGYQCTEFAHRYLHFKWKVSWIPNGNAGEWCNAQPPASSGVVQSTTPGHGDLIVFAPGSCGADGVYGHVAVVDVVDSAKAKVTAVEQNGARRGSYNINCAKCFLHVVANDGTNPGETIGTGTPSAGDAGSKPVVTPDAGTAPVSPTGPRDAGSDSGARGPSMQPADDESTVEPTKKTDAGVRKDAGNKPDDEDDEEPAEDDAEVEEDSAPSTAAAADGCNVAPGSSGSSTLFSLLACLGAIVARRKRR